MGCKWPVSLLMAVNDGVNRPGVLERHIEGISKKVLSERLRKLTHYGMLDKTVFAEVPPSMEYSITRNGNELTKIIGQIHALDERIKDDTPQYVFEA